MAVIVMASFNFFKKKTAQGNSGYQEMHSSELEKLVAQKGADQLNIIDVRTPQEFAEGHIPHARNINIMDGDFMERINQLPKEQPYYLICRSGNRSGQAARKMQAEGFQELYNISGGMLAWDAEVEQ
jgi:rhodanese-related sulfurtransferase